MVAADLTSTLVALAMDGPVSCADYAVDVATNQTAELVAVCKALILLLLLPGTQPALLRTDKSVQASLPLGGLQVIAIGNWWA